MLGRRIRIIGRLRPSNNAVVYKKSDNTRLTIRKDDFDFDHVYSESSTQADIFKGEMRTCIEDLFTGQSTLMTVMGVSGSSKSKQILGGSSKQRGMVLRAIEFLMEKLTYEFELTANIYYVHNNKIESLISSSLEQTNMEQIPIRSVEDLEFYCKLAKDTLSRTVQSSRDPQLKNKLHFVIRFSLHKHINSEFHLLSQLTFVETAGLEYYNTETTQIKKSERQPIISSFNSLLELITDGTTKDNNILTQSIGENFQNYLVLMNIDLSKAIYKQSRTSLILLQTIKDQVNMEHYFTNEVMALKQGLEQLGFKLDSQQSYVAELNLKQIQHKLNNMQREGKKYATRLLVECDVIEDRLKIIGNSPRNLQNTRDTNDVNRLDHDQNTRSANITNYDTLLLSYQPSPEDTFINTERYPRRSPLRSPKIKSARSTNTTKTSKSPKGLHTRKSPLRSTTPIRSIQASPAKEMQKVRQIRELEGKVERLEDTLDTAANQTEQYQQKIMHLQQQLNDSEAAVQNLNEEMAAQAQDLNAQLAAQVQNSNEQMAHMEQVLNTERGQFVDKIRTMEAEATELTNRLQDEVAHVQQRSNDLSQRLQQLESEHLSKDELINNYAQTLEERSNHIQVLELQNQNVRTDLGNQEDRNKELEEQNEQIQSQFELEKVTAQDAQRRLEEISDSYEVRFKSQMSDIDRLKSENDMIQNEVNDLRYEINNKNEHISKLQQVEQESQTKIVEQSQDYENLAEEVKQAQAKIEKKSGKFNALKEEKEKILKDMEEERTGTAAEIEGVEGQVEGIMAELVKLQRDNEDLLQRERDLQRENQRLAQRFQNYKDDVRQLESAPTRMPTIEAMQYGYPGQPVFSPGYQNFQHDFRDSPGRIRQKPDMGEVQTARNSMGSRLRVLEDIHDMIRKHRPT